MNSCLIQYITCLLLVNSLHMSLTPLPLPSQPTPPPKHPHPPPSPPPLHFADSPYTEWMSQRWTYSNDNFSDWPSLPPFIDTIQQVSSGSLGGEPGTWFLTNSSLFFALNLDGTDPESVQFVDIGDDLEIEVVQGSRVATDAGETVFLATPYNVSLLDCSSQDPKFT